MSLGVDVTQFPDQNTLIAGSKLPITRGFAIAETAGKVEKGQLLIQLAGATTPPDVFGEAQPLVVKIAANGVPTTSDVVFIASCDFDATGAPDGYARSNGYIQGEFRMRSLNGYRAEINAELLAQGIVVHKTIPIEKIV